MHLRSAALKLLGFSLLVGVFGVSMAEAGIRTVHPLRVKISLPDDGRFSEEVRGRFATTGELPEDWSLDIVTTNEEGAEVSRRTMTEEVASKQGSATSIPFVLDLADAPVKKSLAIRGEIRDVRGKVVARGRTVIEREEVVPAPTLSDLALVKTEENAQITFTYDHVGETGPVFPQLKVYEHTKNGPVVVESLQQVESVEAGERLTLNFEFPLPGDPESYLIEVDILNEARRSLTGIQKERLIVPGDFADVLAFASFPERFWRAGNDVQLIFSGVATKSEVPLLMKLSVFGLR